MQKYLSTLALASLLSLSISALIENSAHAEDAEAVAKPGTISFGASAFAGLPVGDFADFADAGLGVTADARYLINDKLDASARAGFVYYLIDVDGLNFYEIPLWLGARYYLGSRDGIYVGGDLAINHFVASTDDNGFGGSSSDSNTELGANLVGGLSQGSLRIEGGVYIGDIGESGKTMMLGASIGTSF